MLPTFNTPQKAGLLLGPAFFLILLSLPLPEGMPEHSLQVAAVATLMASFWISEAIPIPATALIPIVLFPVLGIMPTAKVTAFYSHHLIFLFMGGFLIAVTIEKWNLHKRIALRTILLVGTSANQIILGFMLATAFLSAWISNTATAMMMLSIGMAVIKQAQKENSPFATALMLGIAYAASIGGIATLIGTPPNAILAGIIEANFNYTISFAQWMAFGTPLSLIMLFLCWYYLTHIAQPSEFKQLPGGKQSIHQQLNELGAMSGAEKKTLMVFLLVATGWLTRSLLDLEFFRHIKDSSIAITGALLLFIIPAGTRKGEKNQGCLLDWDTAKNIPWDIMILFGGGFALAGGFASSGLTEWIASQLTSLQGMDLMIIVFMVVLMVIFLTEITSNTATSSLLLPVMGAFAVAIQVHPLNLMVAVALAASFAFMLPVATPPNAIVFSSRQISIQQMSRAGIWLNIIGSVLITLFVIFYLPVVFNLD
ncbi:MAG TPA: DASS family sodium-coupled anion symporter [Gammaproteobacteria bacterium]|nr:DASS family sodium-coupled anion symporter [Gammaproteobacteria bacterium]